VNGEREKAKAEHIAVDVRATEPDDVAHNMSNAKTLLAVDRFVVVVMVVGVGVGVQQRVAVLVVVDKGGADGARTKVESNKGQKIPRDVRAVLKSCEGNDLRECPRIRQGHFPSQASLN